MAAEATSSNAPSLFTQMRPKEEPGPIPEKVAEREGRAIGVSLIDIGGCHHRRIESCWWGIGIVAFF